MKLGKAVILLGCGMMAGNAMAAEVSITADAGYRVDNLDWNIAGDVNGANPNVLSELKWGSLDTAQVRLGFNAELGRAQLRTRGGYSKVQDGNNQDSDYSLDNRNGEFLRSNNQADGSMIDGSVAVGYRLDLTHDGPLHMHIMPLAGYAVNQQKLKMVDGVQTIPATGSFAGLDSSYDADWRGPWVGFSWWETDDSRDFTVRLDVEYHQADYTAEANWNLRADLAHPRSFSHWADGHGMVLSLNSSYGLTERLALTFGLDYQSWSTRPGLDRVFRANGSTEDTRLNEVNWDSAAINLGVELSF
ncbi:MAG: TonB-dependent receptor [Gammaproteobacteria bacterium]|nr:TonB-dependent receptor [Gammaproteobacteria bacterium]